MHAAVPKGVGMLSVPLWVGVVFVVVLVAAVTVAVISTRLLFHNSLGLPDLGHRCFRVADTKTHLTLLDVIQEISGIKEAMTFEPAPTVQTLLNDGRTVIMRANDLAIPAGAGPNFVSLPVEGEPGEGAPMAAAVHAQAMFARQGITLDIHRDPLPQLGEKAVLATCEKFYGWSLMFRLESSKLGRPPRVHKLTGPDGLIVKLMRRLPER